MKKETVLILACALVVAAMVSVKVVEVYTVAHGQVIDWNLLACDPNDPPPPPNGGE